MTLYIILQALFNQLPKPFAVLGDFNAKHPSWGEQESNDRGRALENFVMQYEACIINDGQRTHFHVQTATLSDIYLAIVSPELTLDLNWHVSDCARKNENNRLYEPYPTATTKVYYRKSRLEAIQSINEYE